MYKFEKNEKIKFAKFRCYNCKKVVFGLPDEFIGKFERSYNSIEEMYWTNETEYFINSTLKYDGLCPNCGKEIHIQNEDIKYLILDFDKF